MKKIKIIYLLLIMLFVSSCHNYNGWKKVEIPTNSEIKATIKIKEEWEFIAENNIITLLDKKSDTIIAEQIFQGVVNNPNGETTDNDNRNFVVNTSLSYDYKNKDNYEFFGGNSHSVWVWKYNDGTNELYLIGFHIYLDFTYGHYDLAFFWYEDIETEDYYRFIDSYRFAGEIKH